MTSISHANSFKRSLSHLRVLIVLAVTTSVDGWSISSSFALNRQGSFTLAERGSQLANHNARIFALHAKSKGSSTKSKDAVKSSSKTAAAVHNADEDIDRPKYYAPREPPSEYLTYLEAETQNRPGAILETEEQALMREQILRDVAQRSAQDVLLLSDDYGELIDDEETKYVNADDPDALDAETLGAWTMRDLQARYEYEWDPLAPQTNDNMDPNIRSVQKEMAFGASFVTEAPIDDEGIEVGWDPVFGHSNPIDSRTMIGSRNSFMTDIRTRNESMLEPQFAPHDPELALNDQVVQFRNTLEVIETTIDPFLPDTLPVPIHVAKWHGYPEPDGFEPKNYTNNRFTDNPTNFDEMTPFRARQRAVELARSKNAEWLPAGVSQAWHAKERAPYEAYQTLVGTLRKGECDANIVDQIQPALQIFGSCTELLSIKDGVFRFHYHGLIKNKYGMNAWMESLLQDTGVEVTGVIFETGFRKRDPAYDGGDPYYAVIS
ncbi:hypothetical protein MPSEU_000054900 [Mayamaea pseudoterrestris]|nr:hypothetical protein MPSEU_000054900 [Mayamaea pseudoterrestris]